MVLPSVGLVYRQGFPHKLQFTILCDSAIQIVFQYFDATNPGIPQRVFCRLLGDRHPGGLQNVLGRRHLWPQSGGVVEAPLGKPMYLSRVSAESIAGCLAAACSHYIGGFWSGQYRHWRAP